VYGVALDGCVGELDPQRASTSPAAKTPKRAHDFTKVLGVTRCLSGRYRCSAGDLPNRNVKKAI
jgi:hypothetical protein